MRAASILAVTVLAVAGWTLVLPVVSTPVAVSMPLTTGPSLVSSPNPEVAPAGSATHAPLFPPNRPAITAANNCTVSPVVPACLETGEPEPMGITDYGVSGYGNPTPYAYGTDIFLANMSWSSAYIYSSGSKADFSVQLNVVLNFINGGQNYSFWIQNVPVPVDTTKNDLAMSYANNIWNFSCPSTTCNLATNTVTGNGTDSGGVYVWPASANSGCAGGKTGTCDTLDGPNWFDAEVRAFLNPSGEPEVRFCYFDSQTPLSCYDTVTFGFAKRVTTFRGFFVDGFSMNPSSLFEDAEWELGGPGGGAATKDTGPSNIHMTLDYWNGHNFQSVPSAWNGGDDTAEAISSDQSIFSQDGSGTPLTVQLNGTTREAFENPAYTLAQVGTLQLWAPGTNTGDVAVSAEDWGYQFGDATLTLVPGTYHVWVNSTGGPSVDMGMCTITGGSTLNVSTGSPCVPTVGGSPTVSAPTASPSSIDVGQTTTFSTTASGGTGSYSSYAWTVSPAVGLSCAATTTSGSNTCTGVDAGVYTVSVSVTDSLGTSSATVTSGSFTVHPDPTVSVPTASPTTITLGQSVTFTTTLGLPGSGGDAYSWAASPAGTAGCTASTSLTFSCTPTAAGSYTATATVRDSNGGTGSNTSLAVTVAPANPTVGSLVASPDAGVDVGQTISWTATVSGGTAPYTYAWTASPAAGLGCPASGAPPLSCVPTTAGTYTLTLTVTDAHGLTGTATSTAYTVDPLPSVTAPTPSPSSPVVGSSLTLTSTLSSDGAGGDSFAWTISPSGLGCATTNSLSITCTPSTPGSYTVAILATDSNGGSGTATATITVAGSGLSVSAQAAPDPGTAGSAVAFSSTVSEKAGPAGTYGYSWHFGDGQTSTAADPSHTYTSSGTYTVVLFVNDSAGNTGSASFQLVVVGAPSTQSSPLGFLGPYGLWILVLVIVAVAAAVAVVALSRRRREPPQDFMAYPEATAPLPFAAAAGPGAPGADASGSLEPPPERTSDDI